MRIGDLFELVWTNLWRRKARTLLTMLGVLIGTAAIILMMSMGLGLQNRITEEFQAFGNVRDITVMPAMQMSGSGLGMSAKAVESIGDEDVRLLKSFKGVEAAAPDLGLGLPTTLKLGRYVANLSINGYAVREGLPLELAEGRTFGREGEASLILGYNVPDFFTDERGRERGEDQRLQLTNRSARLTLTRTTPQGTTEARTLRVKIVGILAESGGTGDYSVYMPMDMVKELRDWATGARNSFGDTGYDTITVRAENIDDVEALTRQITDEGYTAFSMKEILGQLNQVFAILSAILGGIGAVSLLVASFGIINTMSMAIYERTREIGIMKVVGASIKDIRSIFLWEAGAIGLFGGLSGILLSMLLARIIDAILAMYLTTQGGSMGGASLFLIPTWLILFALAFATLVGLLSGLRPAMKAARLSALGAIRTE